MRFLDEAQFGGPHGRLRPVGDVELGDYLLDVVLDRAYAEHQLLGDLTVRAAEHQKTQDLDLPCRERPEDEIGLLAGGDVFGDGDKVAGFSPGFSATF